MIYPLHLKHHNFYIQRRIVVSTARHGELPGREVKVLVAPLDHHVLGQLDTVGVATKMVMF